ncbi:multipass membrane protein [Candidatus Mancarchaeum acidiphilum]|uniref:Multipass membrane protein n=1 Tax=Candidatus Mancarchaeum acidiphilum TaxID=1920749 RepID=A0A218NNI4_9ARCH|nr:hypothetical protein [Candidatus Mancarchaeum acidiphilum]ASI14031.1 multipass membrane protein [Candidatus Mancarchaeum acidiphilum]
MTRLRFAAVGISLFLVLFMELGTGFAPAATTSYLPANLCGSMYNVAGNPTGFVKYESLTGLLAISLILLTIMLLITGVLWAFGGLLEMPKLKESARSEIGEVLLTGLIVVIILGSFSLTNFSAGDALPLSNGLFSSRIYYDDCNVIFTGVQKGISEDIGLLAYDDVVKLISSLTLTIEPGYFGYSFSPYAGMGYGSNVIGVTMSIVGGVVMLSFAGILVLNYVFIIMPIFLFIGIVLRTIPWTRPAGGAFIGMFIGFFILFPLLLHFMIVGSIQTINLATVSSSTPTSLPGLSGLTNVLNIMGDIEGYVSDFSGGIAAVNSVITDIIGPLLYIILSLLITLIIAFDFTDTMGDLLGSPSLSSSGGLKKLV